MELNIVSLSQRLPLPWRRLGIFFHFSAPF